MKICKNLLPIFFAVILVASVIPASVLAIDYELLPATLPREETVIFWMHYQMVAPDLMNPFLPRNSYRWHGCVGAAAVLIMVNFENGTIDGYCAKSFEYDSNFTTLTFHLRQGVTWSDGHPFTAEDVAFTLNMLRTNEAILDPYFAEHITEVETPDNYTVIIHFNQPMPRFIYEFDELPMVPKHVWENEDPATFKWSRPESVGPYVLVRSTETEQIFKRIEGKWWGEDIFGPALPKYVMFRYVPNELLVAELAKDGLDIAMLSTISDVKLLKSLNPYFRCWEKLGSDEIITGKFHTVTKMQLNMAKYPWSLPEVRRAISLAINRTLIHNVVGEGLPGIAEPNPIGVVPLYPYHIEHYVNYVEEAGLIDEYEPLKCDPEEAQQILESLGFTKGPDGIYVTPNGTRLTMEIIGRETGPTIEREMVAEMLRSIGIDATARTYSTQIYNEKRKMGDFDAIFENLGSWLDPYYTFEQWHSKYYKPIGERAVRNYMRYKNPEFDEIIDELTSLPYDLTNPQSREAYLRAQEIYYSDVLEIPIIEVSQYAVYNEHYWTGWPDAENRYAGFDVNDYLCALKVFRLQPAQAPPAPTYNYVIVYAVESVPAFTGVDGKSYGPFEKGEAMYVPKEDAERLVSEGLASYSPPVVGLEELSSTVSSLIGEVTSLIGEVGEIKNTMTETQTALTDMITDMETALAEMRTYVMVSSAMSVIAVVLAIVVIALVLRIPKGE